MNKRKTFFATFLLSYIVLALVIAIIYSSVYGSYIGVMRTKSEQYGILQLKNNVSFMDKMLQTLNSNISVFVNSETMTEIFEAKPDIDLAKLINIQNELKNLNGDEYLLKAQYISIENKNFIAAKQNSSIEKDEYFSKIIKFEKLSDEKIIKKIKSGNKNRYMFESENAVISGMPAEVMCLVIPLEKNGRICGYINTLIDTNFVKSVILEGFEAGSVEISDENKQHIYADKEAETDFYKYDKMITRGKDVVLAVRSDYNRWTYIVCEDQKYVFGSISRAKIIIFVVTFLALIFAIVFAKVFMRKNVMPIGKVLDLVEKKNEEKGESIFDNLYSYVFLLKNDVVMLKRYFEKNVDFLRGGIVRKLIDGDFKNFEELTDQCRYTGLDFENKLFWVTVIKSGLDGLSHEVKIKNQEFIEALCYAVLEKHEKWYDGTEFYICRVGENITAILFSTDAENTAAEKSRSGIERILRKQLDNKIGKEFHLGTGKIVDNALHIINSYNAVLADIDEKRSEIKIHHTPISSNYWYPLEVENRIANVVIKGEHESMKKISEEILIKNFEEQRLNNADLTALYYELKATLVKLLKMHTVEVSEEVISAPNDEKPEAAIKYILNVMEEICAESFEKSKNKDEESYDKIKHFIYKNYWNPDMSLTLISEKFGLNETYISALFKKHSDSYLNYLESVRLESACKMMLSEKIGINEIAEIVGYNSDQSFRRAFKRRYGISPTSYKELYKDN